MAESRATQERRRKLRGELIKAAEDQIAEKGLESLTARALAAQIGCSVGAIYNVFADLDELVDAVNSRTLAKLDRKIAKQIPIDPFGIDPKECLVGLGVAYCQFAMEHTRLWSSLFEHGRKPDRTVPDWHFDEHARLVSHIVGVLKEFLPRRNEEEIWSLAGLLLSAVHGVVSLGLQEFFFAVPVDDIPKKVELLLGATLRGLEER